ncbi:transcriptional regulator NrdR [Mitsuokella sp. oral taxon 131]|uniref:transcriptional regulator NrdR n=1 Tax=Mitsuokella sp. oral taxon 131 TaxID=1321780 RepID=UPI00058ADABA|nr:transcriptional regulator NrdR [Mitsuokella sp. oral taxon 131]
MRCPYCKTADSRVVDSRAADDGATIRRRRECNACGKRFTTYEVVEKLPLMVVKNDGRREVFKRDKILNGLIRSCDKRDISMERIAALANAVERDIRNTMDQEVPSKRIGELVMEKLKDFDDVAYIRFASVYRKFADVSGFLDELKELQARKKCEADKVAQAEKGIKL